MKNWKIKASYYQQFDADYSLEAPGEGYGGWQTEPIEVSQEHTALVVMHALDCGSPEQYPGWHRAIEYIDRSNQIGREIFPPLLRAGRESGMTIFHVASRGEYYKHLPGYQKAVALAGPPPPFPTGAESDPSIEKLKQFRRERVSVGLHNEADIKRGGSHANFLSSAQPDGEEGIAEDAHQLNALCREAKVNHLIYVGFAINWCLLMSPGGMVDMSRRGYMCSTIREAVTAVENKETAREELCKQIALWRVALAFGFVFGVDDFMEALQQ